MKIALSRNLLPLSVAFLLTALTLAVAPAAHAQDGACGVIDSPCTLAEISAQALVDSGAADVVKAGFTSAQLPDGTELSLYKVRVRFLDGTEDTLYYNTADCSAVLPPIPTVSFLDAMAAAVAKSQEVAPGLALPIVLSGKLVNELLAPTYVFQLLDPQGHLMGVRVDALTGEATVVDEKAGKKKGKKKKKKKGKKGQFKCNDADSDSDSDSDSDEDSDSDSDGDSDGDSENQD
ncbi:MAG: hypothetical protein JRG85_11235 [Deltaproteobacteria bacterium]|nr:hypothetical protein [Deltaproteobacteria bacterium]